MSPPDDNLISHGSVVSFHYTLTDDDGDVIDSSEGREPLAYLHGFGNIVPGLERQLEGLSIGDALDAVVPPGEGYGEVNPAGIQKAPRAAFPPDAELQPGMQVAAQGPGGQWIPLWIREVHEDFVIIDRNHPLAGVTLHFAVQIVSVRAGSEEELAHGHPHGPGGHGHGHDHG